MNKYLRALYQDQSYFFVNEAFRRMDSFLPEDNSIKFFEKIVNQYINVTDVYTLWELSEENEKHMFNLLISNDRKTIKAAVNGDINDKLELWANAYPQEFASEVKKLELKKRILRTKPKPLTNIFKRFFE